MKLKFLGTGAADWNGPDETGQLRRLTSTLIDERLLIDVSRGALEMIPDVRLVSDVLFTHSHSDHFNIDALKSLAPCRVYAHESWAGEIRGEGLAVTPLRIGAPVSVSGYDILPMPSNHSTERAYETTLHYLIEKDGKRMLYATDGAWLLNKEHRLLGNTVLDAVVFDATIGDGHEGDWRVFEHNSLDMIRIMVCTMRKSGRLKKDGKVFLTHFARTLHPSQSELEEKLTPAFTVCFDGFEATV